MKRRFSLFFNIATLVLCVCAIAIGVYSAKTASLNIGGSVGFVAHNCKASVSARVKNDAVKTVDGVITPDAEGTLNEEFRELGPATVNEKTGIGELSLGKIYFTDLTTSGEPATIVLEITITNLSDFAITIDLTESSVTDTNVTVAESSSQSTATIETKDGTSVFTFNISLQKVLNVSDTSPNLNINFDLAKKATVAGYNVSIQTKWANYENGIGGTGIKFDTEPTSDDDYDFLIISDGIVTGNTSFTNRTKMYVWSWCGQININSVDCAVGKYYSSATCFNLTENTNVIAYYFGEILPDDPIKPPITPPIKPTGLIRSFF